MSKYADPNIYKKGYHQIVIKINKALKTAIMHPYVPVTESVSFRSLNRIPITAKNFKTL